MALLHLHPAYFMVVGFRSTVSVHPRIFCSRRSGLRLLMIVLLGPIDARINTNGHQGKFIAVASLHHISRGDQDSAFIRCGCSCIPNLCAYAPCRIRIFRVYLYASRCATNVQLLVTSHFRKVTTCSIAPLLPFLVGCYRMQWGNEVSQGDFA